VAGGPHQALPLAAPRAALPPVPGGGRRHGGRLRPVRGPGGPWRGAERCRTGGAGTSPVPELDGARGAHAGSPTADRGGPGARPRPGRRHRSRTNAVLPYLRQFGLHDAFAAVVTADDVPRTKPAPDLYLLAARRLGVAPASVVAFEDSSRGVRAAKAAGTFCVAVPHVLSRSHDFDGADLRLDSLSLCDLDDLDDLVSARPSGATNGRGVG
jgi:hypothetical protein